MYNKSYKTLNISSYNNIFSLDVFLSVEIQISLHSVLSSAQFSPINLLCGLLKWQKFKAHRSFS